MRRSFSHQIRKEEYIVFTKFLNRCLLRCEIFCLKNFFCPPFVAGSRTQHTSHQMITSVCMAERMQCIVFVNTKVFTGNKDSSGSTKRNITLSVTNSSCSDSSCRIVTGTCYNFNVCWETKLFCHFRFQCTDNFPALIQLWKLFFFYITDFHHFFWPATILHIKKKHTGCIRNICAERSGKSVCQIIFRKHNFCDLCKFIRLVFLHPEDLRCCKSCKCNVCCVCR